MILSLRTWIVLIAAAAVVLFVSRARSAATPAGFGPDSLFGEDAAGNCVPGWIRGRDGVCRDPATAVMTYIPDAVRGPIHDWSRGI